jgi:hypothetical protein
MSQPAALPGDAVAPGLNAPWCSEVLDDGKTLRADYTDLDFGDEPDPQASVHADLVDGSDVKPLPLGERPSSPFSVHGDPQWVLPSGHLGFEEGSAPFFIELAKREELFLQGDKIVEVVHDRETNEVELVIVDHSAFRSRVELVGPIREWRKRGDEYVLSRGRCSEEISKGMIKTRAKRKYLKKIRLVLRSPLITEDVAGDLQVHCKGYHPIRGGVYICGGRAPPEVPLPEALRAIARVYEDFLFLTWGDRMRAWLYPIIAALIMGDLLRTHAPIHLVEALRAGSGKTYLQDLTAAFFGEIPYLASNTDRGVGGLDEALAEGMMRGRTFIKIDNLELDADHKFDSEYLEQVLTAERASARVPYQRAVEVDPKNHFFCVNTNGTGFTPGLLRRSWPIRIRKRPHDFRRNVYREGDRKVLDHVRAHQPYYLGCIFSVIREWHRAGRPRTKERRHSFEECAQVADWIVQNVFKTEVPLFNDYDLNGELLPALEPAYTYSDEGEELFSLDSPVRY